MQHPSSKILGFLAALAQIEAMTSLDQVPATGAVIVVTWPKVDHGFGFPARAFAILP